MLTSNLQAIIQKMNEKFAEDARREVVREEQRAAKQEKHSREVEDILEV